MLQGNSGRDYVISSAPIRHLPGSKSSNQWQHSKFGISDTSQSSPKDSFNQYDIYPLGSLVNCVLSAFKLREFNGDALCLPESSGIFLSTIDYQYN